MASRWTENRASRKRVSARGRWGDSRLGTGGGAGGYPFVNAEAATLVRRWAAQPSTDRAAAVDTFFTSIKSGAVSSSNILAKLDQLYVYWQDEQASHQNWAQNAYNTTKVGSVTFAQAGATGDGSTGYLSTGFAPGVTGGSKGTQNSQHLGAYCAGSDFSNLSVAIGGVTNFLQPRTGGNMGSRVHQGASATVAVAAGLGHAVVSRTGAAVVGRYKDAVALADDTTASAAPSNSPNYIFARNASSAGGDTPGLYFAGTLFAAHSGSSLTANEVTDLYNALTTLQSAFANLPPPASAGQPMGLLLSLTKAS